MLSKEEMRELYVDLGLVRSSLAEVEESWVPIVARAVEVIGELAGIGDRAEDCPARLICRGDEIYSSGTQAWHLVRSTGQAPGGVRIEMKRNGTWATGVFPPGTVFRVRRGPAGKAADMLGADQVMRS